MGELRIYEERDNKIPVPRNGIFSHLKGMAFQLFIFARTLDLLSCKASSHFLLGRDKNLTRCQCLVAPKVSHCDKLRDDELDFLQNCNCRL